MDASRLSLSDVFPLAVAVVDGAGKVCAWNPAAEQLLGWRVDEMLGRPLPVSTGDGSLPPAELPSFLGRVPGSGVDLRVQRKDGGWREVRLWAAALPSTGTASIVCVIVDDAEQRAIRERTTVMHRLAQVGMAANLVLSGAALEGGNFPHRGSVQLSLMKLLQRVADAANQSVSIEPALQRSLELICEHIGWPVGHVYMVNHEPEPVLRPTGLWCVQPPVERFEAFRRLTESTHFPAGVGLPGRVFAAARPAWILDVTVDRNFPRSPVAAECGLRSGFGFPVLLDGQVAAVLEFFAPECIQRDDELLEAMVQVGTQLGWVIERARANRERAELLERERAARAEADQAKRQLVFSKLSQREQEVVRFIAGGADNMKIAAHLGISQRTVKAHISSVLRKLDLDNRTQVAVLAISLGIQPPEGL